jgi:hypothetical protein
MFRVTTLPRSRIARAAAAVAATALGLPAAALAHGDEVPVDELWWAWQLAPVVLVAAAVALVLFAQGFLRLRRRGRRDLAGLDRALLLYAIKGNVDSQSPGWFR